MSNMLKYNLIAGVWYWNIFRCCRKQLVIANDTRRVDILCYRVSLSQKLLKGTEKYHKLYDMIDEAVKKLQADVGPLTGLPVKMGRGIVNRLSSGTEVKKLCSFALELLESILSNATSHPLPPIIKGKLYVIVFVIEPRLPDFCFTQAYHSKYCVIFRLQLSRELVTRLLFCVFTFSEKKLIAPDMVKFEDVHATSLTMILGYVDSLSEKNVVCTLWHCKARDLNYPKEPTCTLYPPNTRFFVTGLAPATEYSFKVVLFDATTELSTCEVRFSTSTGGEEVHNSSVMDRSQSPATNCSSLSNPSSVEDETNNINPFSDQAENRADNYLSYCKDSGNIVSTKLSNDAIDCNDTGEEGTPADTISLLDEEHGMRMIGSISNSDVLKLDSKQSPDDQIIEDTSTDDGSNTPVRTGMECVPVIRSSEASLPITPCKLEILKDGLGRNGRSKSSSKDLKNGTGKGEEPQDGSTSKKRSGETLDEDCTANGLSDRDFEYYVKVIRWLECEGHIEKNFRQKFLTWYSLRATPQEVRIVKVFVDNFIEDPASLAGQLVDTFSESISSKRVSVVPNGFCMRLWH